MREFILGIQARLLRRTPIGVRQHPIELAFCVLAIPSAVATLFGANTSRALSVLPVWAQALWGVAIIVGCVAWAFGLLTTKQIGHDIVITRIELMIFGLSIVSGTCLVYAIAMIALNGMVAVLAAMPLLTFAVGTYIRRIDLISRMKDKNGP